MRLADLDELINKAINLEAEAFEQVKKYEPLDNPNDWRTWSAILTERSAFKFDLMNAPTIEAEPTEEQVKEYCRKRNLVVISSALFNRLKEYYGGSER